MFWAAMGRSCRDEPDRKANGRPTPTPVPNATKRAMQRMHHCLPPTSAAALSVACVCTDVIRSESSGGPWQPRKWIPKALRSVDQHKNEKEKRRKMKITRLIISQP